MEYNFIINPEIEKLCEEKARTEYDFEKNWKENHKPNHVIKAESIIDEVKSMINDKRLVIIPKGISPFDKEAIKARFTLVNKYAEEAVKKVMEA